MAISFGNLSERSYIPKPGVGKDDIDMIMPLLHGGIQAIKIRKIGNIPLHPGDVFANLLDSSIQFWLPTTSNIDKC